jgi:cytochrome c-type biogenesis protein CcmH
MKHLWIAIAVLLSLAAENARAVEPDEMLDDPALEQRARDISQQLRCVVCQNQDIDSSNAPLARDLRILVRERLAAGASDKEVITFVTKRYGDFVLLRPPFRPSTYLLWFAPLLFVLAGGTLIFVFYRRMQQTPQAAPQPLDDTERSRLSALLESGPDRKNGDAP